MINSNKEKSITRTVRSLNYIEKFFLRLVSQNNAIPILIIRFGNRINKDLFKKALSFVKNYNELLCSTIDELNGEHFIKRTNSPSFVYEYRESEKPILHNDINATVVSKTNSFIIYIILNNLKTSSEVAICYNHTLFDGLSINHLMDDIYKSYTSLIKKESLRIYKKQINENTLQVDTLHISNKLISDYYFNYLQISSNIIFKYFKKSYQYYLDHTPKYFNDIYQLNYQLPNQFYFSNNFQINSFDKLKLLEKNKDYNESTYLSSVKVSRVNYQSISKSCNKNKINIFSYLCSLLTDILHKNYASLKRQEIKILTYINLRDHKNFCFTIKNQGVLICPYLINIRCSDNNDIWEQSRKIFDERSIFESSEKFSETGGFFANSQSDFKLKRIVKEISRNTRTYVHSHQQLENKVERLKIQSNPGSA